MEEAEEQQGDSGVNLDTAWVSDGFLGDLSALPGVDQAYWELEIQDQACPT